MMSFHYFVMFGSLVSSVLAFYPSFEAYEPIPPYYIDQLPEGQTIVTGNIYVADAQLAVAEGDLWVKLQDIALADAPAYPLGATDVHIDNQQDLSQGIAYMITYPKYLSMKDQLFSPIHFSVSAGGKLGEKSYYTTAMHLLQNESKQEKGVVQYEVDLWLDEI